MNEGASQSEDTREAGHVPFTISPKQQNLTTTQTNCISSCDACTELQIKLNLQSCPSTLRTDLLMSMHEIKALKTPEIKGEASSRVNITEAGAPTTSWRTFCAKERASAEKIPSLRAIARHRRVLRHTVCSRSAVMQVAADSSAQSRGFLASKVHVKGSAHRSFRQDSFAGQGCAWLIGRPRARRSIPQVHPFSKAIFGIICNRC